MSGVILVTRTEPGGAAQAEALRAAGFRAEICSVLDIECCEYNPPPLTAPDAVFFMSVHAVRCGLSHIREQMGGTRCFAVGAATADALGKEGIVAQYPKADERTEGLLALPELAQLQGFRVVIVRGEGGREKLGVELEARGASVECLDVYRRVRVTPKAVDLERVDTVIIGSGDGLRAFADMVNLAGRREVELVVPSERVADIARELGFERLCVSDGASDRAVISCLRSRGAHG